MSCGTVSPVPDENSPKFASKILGHLYALGAARICGDREAILLIREGMRDEEEAFLPAAAVAVAYSCVRAAGRGDDPFADERVARLNPTMLDAVRSVIDGCTPDIFMLADGEDPVEVSTDTVALFWQWSADWDDEEALRIARRHCANMVLYRARGDEDDDRDDS